jgi:hypothetical protein
MLAKRKWGGGCQQVSPTPRLYLIKFNETMILSAGIIYMVHIKGASKLPYRVSILTDCKLELPQKEMDACHILGVRLSTKKPSWCKKDSTEFESRLSTAWRFRRLSLQWNGFIVRMNVTLWKKIGWRPLNLDIWHILWANEGVIRRCRLSWLTNSAIVYEPKCGGMGGGGS